MNMEVTYTVCCDVCGAKDSTGLESFAPPPLRGRMSEHISDYLPYNWQFVHGFSICPAHDVEIVVTERITPIGENMTPKLFVQTTAGKIPFSVFQRQWLKEKEH